MALVMKSGLLSQGGMQHARQETGIKSPAALEILDSETPPASQHLAEQSFSSAP